MRGLVRRLSAVSMQFVLIVPLLISLMPIGAANAVGEPEFTGTNSLNAVRGVPSAVNLQLTASDMNVVVPVTLTATEGYMRIATTTGLTMQTATSGRTVGMSGTIANLNAALATLTYTPASGNADTLMASLNGAGDVFFPDNGHIYEVVAVDGGIDWVNANAAAAARTRNGSQGYLATITSQSENDYVSTRLGQAGWMGANDIESEGSWEWTSGPEAGMQFWSGDSSGSAVDGNYEEWADSEPNDYGTGEDCAQYLSGAGGEWNDLPCEDTLLPAYVVEYGAPGDLPFQASKSISITNTNSASISLSDCQMLQNVRFDLDANYVLTGDIDCSETQDWNEGTGWVPIGDEDYPFVGTLNGNGHKVTALYAQDDNRSFSGVFGLTNNAEISNITFDSAWVRGATYTGGVAGRANNTIIDNVHFNGTAWARFSYYGGGIAGFGDNLTITNSSTSGFAHGSGNVIGGLVGYLDSGTIDGSYSTADIDGGTEIGGIIGNMNSGTVTDVYATGSIDVNTDEDFKAGMYGGGLVGGMYGGTISRAYATGDVSVANSYGGGFVGIMKNGAAISESYATGNVDSSIGGGFVGYMTDETTVANAYAHGNVAGAHTNGGFIGEIGNEDVVINKAYAKGHVDDESNAGGFVGVNAGDGVIQNAFWDSQTSGFISGSDATPKTSQQMKTPNTFKSLSSEGLSDPWNTSIWVLKTGHYPVLAAFYESDGDDDGDGVSSAAEDAAPNGGDANNDGTADSSQANVSTFANAITGKYAVLEVPEDCTVSTISQKAESTFLASDSGYSYPLGLMDFSIECGTPGYVATIKQYYYDAAPASFLLRKYNSTTNSYATVSGVRIDTITIDGKQVTVATYQVKDGGALDEDAVENGTIVDPAGLAVSAVGAPNTGLGGKQR